MPKVFRSNRSQAVRLPKSAEYPDGTEVDVVVHGNVRILIPRNLTWDEWLKYGPRFTDDYPKTIEDLQVEPLESDAT